MDNRREMVSVAEAARQLGRSTEQVRRYLREGRLAGRRIGGCWFIDDAALDDFLSGLPEEKTFRARIRATGRHDPLGEILGIGSGGGSNIADGKDAYRRAFRWRR